MAQDIYYSRTECSNSDLSELDKLLNPGIFTPDYTEALRFGSLVDAFITEPEKVNVYKRSLEGEVYLQSEFDLAREMKRAFYADPTCAAMMKVAVCQKASSGPVSFDWNNFIFEIMMRCRWDIFVPFLKQGADIKTTTATTLKGFEDACTHFNYFRSRFIYMSLENTQKDMLIGISKVNKRIFKIPITRGDKYWEIGKQQATELAFQFWYLFDGFGKNNLVLL
jgi:hypothetical protein